MKENGNQLTLANLPGTPQQRVGDCVSASSVINQLMNGGGNICTVGELSADRSRYLFDHAVLDLIGGILRCGCMFGNYSLFVPCYPTYVGCRMIPPSMAREIKNRNILIDIEKWNATGSFMFCCARNIGVRSRNTPCQKFNLDKIRDKGQNNP